MTVRNSKNIAALKLAAIIKSLNPIGSFIDDTDFSKLPNYRKIKLIPDSRGNTLVEFGSNNTLFAGMVYIEFSKLTKFISDHRNELDSDGYLSYLLPTKQQDGVIFKHSRA